MVRIRPDGNENRRVMLAMHMNGRHWRDVHHSSPNLEGIGTTIVAAFDGQVLMSSSDGAFHVTLCIITQSTRNASEVRHYNCEIFHCIVCKFIARRAWPVCKQVLSTARTPLSSGQDARNCGKRRFI
eukprot:3223754-Amphidinium_carterae.2